MVAKGLAVTSQSFLLLTTWVLGFLLGFVLDCYRFFTRRLRRSYVLWLTDFLLWVWLAGCTFLVLLYLNGAEIHFYVFVGLALGTLMYFRWLSQDILSFLKKFFRGR